MKSAMTLRELFPLGKKILDRWVRQSDLSDPRSFLRGVRALHRGGPGAGGARAGRGPGAALPDISRNRRLAGMSRTLP
jgi:hypothetical protein